MWATKCDIAPLVSGEMKNWFEPILKYFMERWTNLFTEGGSQEDWPP
jgi:hypothetical protein